MPVRKKSVSTRERLIQAACDVFAEKGYRDSTVAEICARAGANIAALNYHLGDKAAAYREAYQTAFAEGLSSYPIDFDSQDPPVVRLRSHVGSLLHRMNTDAQLTRFERIRNWELISPTGLVDNVDYNVRKTSRQHMVKCLQEIAGDNVSEEDVVIAEALVLSMTRMLLGFNRRDITFLHSRRVDDDVIGILTKHIIDLLTGGIRHCVLENRGTIDTIQK